MAAGPPSRLGEGPGVDGAAGRVTGGAFFGIGTQFTVKPHILNMKSRIVPTRVEPMKPYRAAGTRIIQATPAKVYAVLADYGGEHRKILPKPYFQPLVVEEGGRGAGTIIRFQMRVFGRTQDYRATITEPEPGRQLDEIYLQPEGVVTRFLVQPLAENQHSKVTITTEGPTRTNGLAAWFERLVAAVYLRRIFRKELDLLARLVE